MQSPQLVVVARAYDEHVRWICEAAQARNIAVEHIAGSAEEVERRIGKLRDVIVLWRSSRLSSVARLRVLTEAERHGCTVINQALVREPRVRSKAYQQQIARENRRLAGIPTYAAIDVPNLTFPVIAKPPIGSQGKGILFLSTLDDFKQIPPAEVDSYIYQTFIPNTGDYRVIVVGGVPLGVMRRVGKAGEYRNNISLGGHGETVIDAAERAEVLDLALRVVNAFCLQICGVDIIRNCDTGELHFLEVNTVPEWNGEGFQKTTGVHVAEKIVDYIATLLMCPQRPMAEVIRHWYEANMDCLPSIAFHWWSRMYLWTRDQVARAQIDVLRSHVFGNSGSVDKYFHEILSSDQAWGARFPEARKRALDRYPDLMPVQSILAKTLFAQTLYGEDIRSTTERVIGRDRLRELHTQLLSDEHDLILLNTYAVNVISFIDALFSQSLQLETDPGVFIRAMERGLANVKAYRPRDLMYLATHVIIGASYFYDKPISEHRAEHERLLTLAERVLRTQRNEIPLDAQLEFVVAHRLLGTSTDLEESILHAAEKSTHPQGVYISDPNKKLGAHIFKAEHRNALFVMANVPLSPARHSFKKI